MKSEKYRHQESLVQLELRQFLVEALNTGWLYQVHPSGEFLNEEERGMLTEGSMRSHNGWRRNMRHLSAEGDFSRMDAWEPAQPLFYRFQEGRGIYPVLEILLPDWNYPKAAETMSGMVGSWCEEDRRNLGVRDVFVGQVWENANSRIDHRRKQSERERFWGGAILATVYDGYPVFRHPKGSLLIDQNEVIRAINTQEARFELQITVPNQPVTWLELSENSQRLTTARVAATQAGVRENKIRAGDLSAVLDELRGMNFYRKYIL